MEDLFHQRENLVLILVKQTQIFFWVCIIMLIIVICLLMEKKSSSLQPTIKILTFHLNFVSEAYLMDSLNGNVYDFSVDYNFIDKSDMLKNSLSIYD